MKPRAVAAACCLLLLTAGQDPAAARYIARPPPNLLPLGYQPPANSDEAGLWYEADQVEQKFRTSPALVRDPALNAYVKGVVCKLVPDRCVAVRIYILDVPYFNASMFPNGAMQVWTGLLTRIHSEAQLGFVLGHEISHYTHRHTINQWRLIRDTSGFLAFFTLASAPFTMGLGGLAASAIALGGIQGYSRDEEREADAAGLELAIKAGYDPNEAASIWKAQGDEEKADPLTDKDFAYFRTHPESDERMQTLSRAAAKAEGTEPIWIRNEEAFHAATAPFRASWLDANLALGKYEASLCLLRRLATEEPDSAQVRYYIGEVHRRRNGKGDAENAIAAYRQAIELGTGVPIAVWRGLGIVAMKTGDKATARDAFTHYLAAAPSANDRAMVELYLSRVQEQNP
jgi:Putative Zn-dependent protease, contains TPR repeats